MLRRLFALLSALSLLLCVAVGVMWVRSYWASDTWGPIGRHWVSSNGGLHLWGYTDPEERDWQFLGFESFLSRRSYSPMRRKTIPYWFPFLVTGLLPAAYAIRTLGFRRTRMNRQAGGLCPSCGYDLRATPGRCPECGTLAAARPSPIPS